MFAYSFFSVTIQVAFQVYIEHLEQKTTTLRLKFELKYYRKILVTSWKDFRTNESTELEPAGEDESPLGQYWKEPNFENSSEWR